MKVASTLDAQHTAQQPHTDLDTPEQLQLCCSQGLVLVSTEAACKTCDTALLPHQLLAHLQEEHLRLENLALRTQNRQLMGRAIRQAPSPPPAASPPRAASPEPATDTVRAWPAGSCLASQHMGRQSWCRCKNVAIALHVPH